MGALRQTDLAVDQCRADHGRQGRAGLRKGKVTDLARDPNNPKDMGLARDPNNLMHMFQGKGKAMDLARDPNNLKDMDQGKGKAMDLGRDPNNLKDMGQVLNMAKVQATRKVLQITDTLQG